MTTPQATTAPTITASKSMRFDVLKRDNYTCQYCGRAAPEVTLEVDHHNPISNGGKATMGNLVTACYDCNRGKSDKVLIKPEPMLKIAYDSGEGRILYDIVRKIGSVEFRPETIAAVTRLIDVTGWGFADSIVWNLFDRCYGNSIQPSLSVAINNVVAVLGNRNWRSGNINLPPCDILCDVGEDPVVFTYDGSENSHCDNTQGVSFLVHDIIAWMPSPAYYIESDREAAQ